MNRIGAAFTNVYRDLRDRRLLPIVLLLVVAIAAVPFLLGEDTANRGGAGGDEAAEVGLAPAPFDSAVVEATPEVRAFQSRLVSFQSTNPFMQEVPKTEEGGGQDAGAAVPSGGTASGDLSDPSTDVPSSDPISDPGTTDSEPPDDTDTDPDADEDVETTLVTTRIDVRVGPVGDTRVIKDVRGLDFLPDRQHPVVEYLQGDFSLTSAVFIVSPFVVTTEGKGKCAPTPKRCQFLQLEIGQEHSFQYEDGVRYRLKLLDVTLHEEPLEEESEESAGREGDFTAALPQGQVVGG